MCGVDQENQDAQTGTTNTSMTPREKMWWSMTLTNYTSLPRARILEGGKEGRKAGRIHIKWLCQREGITPYVAPTVTPAVEATIAIVRPTLRPTGAISHPEAVLRTPDPDLQRLNQ